MSYIAEWSSNCAAMWYTFTLRQTLRNSMWTGVKVSWAQFRWSLGEKNGLLRQVAPPQNHPHPRNKKVEGRQRQNSSTTTRLLHTPPTIPIQPSLRYFSRPQGSRRILQLLQRRAQRFQASQHGALAQIDGQLGEAFAHGSHGRGRFLRLLPISDLTSTFGSEGGMG